MSERLTDILRHLVDIPSVTGQENEICEVLQQRLGGQRISNSLVVGAPDQRPMVLLVGHVDTVPRQGQEAARIDGERLHGLGASDMKAGLAVMVNLLEATSVSPFNLIGVFYAGEEGPRTTNDLETVLATAPWLTTASLAVVLEPTDLEVQLGCNGVINAEVTFNGTAAHSARPWWGENAITKAGTWLAEMHGRSPQPTLVGGLEFKEVMSVTLAQGGVAANIIPSAFTLNLNYRFAPDRTLAEAEALLKQVAGTADGFVVKDSAPAGPVPSEHPLVQSIIAASGRPVAPKQGWTDVATLATHGVAAINYGPGETALAHKPEESVHLGDLDEVRRVLQACLF